MTDRRFARIVRRQLRRELRYGGINREKYNKLLQGSRDRATVRLWRAKLEQPIYGAPWTGDLKTGINWDSVWQWFKDNWPTILKLLLSLLVFLEEKDENDAPASPN